MKKWIVRTGRALTIAIALSSSLIITMAHDSWPVQSDRTAGTALQGAPAVEIRLPERFRLLTDQQFDLRVEAAGLSRPDASLQIILDGKDITSSLPVPEVTIEGMTGEQ